MSAETQKAALTVAAHAHDAADCRQLLAMLGLTDVPRLPRTAPSHRPAEPKQWSGKGRPPVDHGHGDHRTYHKGCRCDACRDANRLYQAELRARRRKDPSSADRAGHGKATTYRNHSCRCAECTAAHTADCTAYKARRRQRAALAETGGAPC